MSRASKTFLALLAIGAAAGVPVHTDVAPTEYEVKAAVLYQFARFVRWPDHAFGHEDDPWKVCVLGPDPFDGALEQTLQDRTAQGRPFRIRRYARAENLDHCQILFVADQVRETRPILQRFAGSPVLLVSDRPDFLEAGGLIELTLDEHRVRFSVHAARAGRSGLRIPSQLLALATRVIQ